MTDNPEMPNGLFHWLFTYNQIQQKHNFVKVETVFLCDVSIRSNLY